MHRHLLHKLFFCILLLVACHCFSQTTQTILYTTKDGLPSNSVYRTILDNRGFLWIATENGLAKFDGKNFKSYTTAQGLQDNEITDIFIDSNQTIWVTPFRKAPAYYNPVTDRFENDDTDPELKKIELANANRGSVLTYGGIAFSNNQRNFFIYKDKKVSVYKGLLAMRSGTPERLIEYSPGKYFIVSSDSIRVFDGSKITRAFPVEYEVFSSEYFNHTLFLSAGSEVRKYYITTNGDLLLQQKKTFPFVIRIFCRAGKNLAVTTFNGTTYPVDTATLNLNDPLMYNIAVRNVLEDKSGSSWISTIDKGLVKIQQKRISSFIINDKTLNDQIAQYFNALLVSNKKIYAGNNYGEVLVYDGVYDIKKISLSSEKNMDGTVREIIDLKDKLYVACQTGSFIVDKATLHILRKFEGPENGSTKAALLLNDSVLLLGGHAQVKKYDIKKDKIVDVALKRVTSLGTTGGKVYVGSNEGLFRWDSDTLFYFGKQWRALSYKINTMCSTPDGLLWIGLGSDSLLVIKNDVVIKSIALGDIIPGNVCKSSFSNKTGELWLGTNKGLNKIEYQYLNDTLRYGNTFFGTSDGLIGEQVNDITVSNDTVYVATSGGISYLPASLHLPVADITTFITRVTIDGKDTLVLDKYSLPYDKNNISIDFSGVDLTGYYPLFEYSINNTGWVRLDKNSIELRLLSGNYDINIRAIKRDGTPSLHMAHVNIYIATPFWKNGIFWSIVVIVLFIVSIFILQRRSKMRQQKAVEKVLTEKKLGELEMQALKAQINPHFVFNCLNSIKGFIYERDYQQADKYLDKFSELLRSTLDNSSSSIIPLQDELRYLDTYLQLEKLRFEDKFEYEIKVDDNIDSKEALVPAMLLQPYVENAIRHGIRHLENKKGYILIHVGREQEHLICEIEDNGIGRDKTYELRSEMHIEYQSRGMQLSKRRAELYGIEQDIIDKKDESGNALGTKIILRIPITNT
ncbi:MAG TPA: histidine kinase [Ferruginibacter sp.]|nr:histidine kinase [Ferruginibacter sp.]